MSIFDIRFLVALRERPGDVVWIYQQSVAVNVKGIAAPVRDSNVIVGLADGKKIAMTVAKTKAEDLFVALTQLAPAAATGFSDEREAQFKQDPQSLLGAGKVPGSDLMRLGYGSSSANQILL